MARGASKTIVKKVSAYPILAQITSPTATYSGKIIKLTMVGILVETEAHLGIGQQFNVNFHLPVSNANILAVMVVVKAYSRHSGELGINKNHHMIELHFRS